MTLRDIRGTEAYRVAEDYYTRSMEPGFGRVTTATQPSLRPDGQAVAVTGTVFEALEGRGRSRVAIADEHGLRVVDGTGYDDRSPRWSPDGKVLAFVSDRAERGVFGLYLLPDGVDEASPAPPVDGSVEYVAWSPDGSRILLGVAARGADVAGGAGSGTVAGAAADGPAWLPEVTGGAADGAWRSVWVYDAQSGGIEKVSPDGTNVWEAVWLGDDRIAAVVSDGDPGEAAWYTATVAVIDTANGAVATVFRPVMQVGWPAGSPSGRRIAVVEASCSDRGIVVGDVRLIDTATGGLRAVRTPGVDVTGLQWLDDRRLGFAGVRGLETVLGVLDIDTGTCTELLSTDQGTSDRFPEAAFAPDGTAALVLESYDRPPAISLVRDGRSTELAPLSHPGTEWLASVGGSAQTVSWTAEDGLEIEGIVCLPDGPGPLPLVVHVHGGPVSQWRNRWRIGNDAMPLYVSRGYAVLNPNPRGSAGRGQDYARAVFGDPGGADARDILAGIDALVSRGLADPDRIGVTGGSYGGYMSCWLVTQDHRFAAAVPVAPVTDWYSKHHTSNIGSRYVQDDPYAAGSRHHTRSPVMHARNARTPTLQIAGALDRCTPPGQAEEFHNALLENGVESELVVYPLEGHGVRDFPARVDATARTLAWFERHMPPG